MQRIGVRHRLSPAVWAAIAADRPPERALLSLTPTTAVKRFSGAIPPQLLQQLRRAFSPKSPFWSETAYLERGYFSFWFQVGRAPANAIESLAAQLLPMTGVAKEVRHPTNPCYLRPLHQAARHPTNPCYLRPLHPSCRGSHASHPSVHSHPHIPRSLSHLVCPLRTTQPSHPTSGHSCRPGGGVRVVGALEGGVTIARQCSRPPAALGHRGGRPQFPGTHTARLPVTLPVTAQ